MSFLRLKPVDLIVRETEGAALKRVLGAGDLILLAIGAVIGAGIFSSIGTAAAGETLPTGEVVRYGALRWSCRSCCSGSSAPLRACVTPSWLP